MAADFRIRLQYCLAFILCLQLTHGFYIPGWSIKSYADGDPIPLLVNKVYSDTTQIQYAFVELPFICPPSGNAHVGDGLVSGSNIALNIGEILRGDRIVVSDYELRMGKDDELHHLCQRTIDKNEMRQTIDLIQQGYVAEWIVDNLPGATSYTTVDNSRKYYAAGFKLGYHDSLGEMGRPRYFLNNHVTLVVRWHRAPGRDGEQGRKVIVGFEVYAKSLSARDLDHATSLPPNFDDGASGFELSFAGNSTNSTIPDHDKNSLAYVDTPIEGDDARLTIPYTYSVYYREEPGVEWASRWDRYFENQEDNERIHWLAIVNSLVIAGLLSAVVLVILARTVRGDIKGYRDGSLEDGKIRPGKKRGPEKSGLLDDGEGATEELGSEDDVADDTAGWKLIHGDVFRTPSFGYLLAPLIGSGMQLVFMATGLILLSCIGWLNPSFRGGFVSVGVALFLVAGVFSGYYSARIYKTFGGTLWKHNAIVTATLFPGLLFSLMFVLNLFVWAQASSTALPISTLIGLVVLWLLVQVPLVYFGSWYGFVRVGPYIHPIKATVIPRQIPRQSWYSRRMQTVAMAGLVPFAVIFIELLFVFQSLWLDKSGYYYVFGFLAVTSTILMLAIMETTVIAVYIQLCAEDHHWWWQSFLTGASSSVWIFFYCAYYYARYLHITGLASTLLFFAYSFLACAVYGLLAGTIGFLTAYAFVRRIYGAIKVD